MLNERKMGGQKIGATAIAMLLLLVTACGDGGSDSFVLSSDGLQSSPTSSSHNGQPESESPGEGAGKQETLLEVNGPVCQISGEFDYGPADKNGIHHGAGAANISNCLPISTEAHPCLADGLNYQVPNTELRTATDIRGSSCGVINQFGNFTVAENQCEGYYSCNAVAVDLFGGAIVDMPGSACQFIFTKDHKGNPTGNNPPTATGYMDGLVSGFPDSVTTMAPACEEGDSFNLKYNGVLTGSGGVADGSL